MEVKFIEHKGNKILYVDYRGAKNDSDLFKVLEKDVEIEKTLTEKSLLLANFENTFLSYRYMEEVKKSGKEIRRKIMKKTALVGITGLKVIMLKSYIQFTGQKNMKTFRTEEEALEWLIS